MRRSTVITVLAVLFVASSASAAPFLIVLNPNQAGIPDSMGTFEAPSTGGYVSLFSVEVFGVTFDMPYPETDNNAPTFHPLLNAIYSPLDTTVPALIAHAGAFDGVVLNLFFDHTYNLNYASSGLVGRGDDTGTYSISAAAVTEPFSILLFGTGAAALTVKARRRKNRQQ